MEHIGEIEKATEGQEPAAGVAPSAMGSPLALPAEQCRSWPRLRTDIEDAALDVVDEWGRVAAQPKGPDGQGLLDRPELRELRDRIESLAEILTND